ncbi:MAG: patatin family protein, partial [Proteobacteria bacterium]|nr:patatin family protein [Pseudomonadota bacterium]
IDGRKLLDGGVTDSIPVKALRQMGFPKCLVVLTQIDGYRKKPSRSPLPRLLYRRYPAFVEAIAQRHHRYNATLDHIAELEASGQIYVLRPSRKVNIKRLERNPERILEMYELGRKDALEHLKKIQAFLSDSAQM